MRVLVNHYTVRFAVLLWTFSISASLAAIQITGVSHEPTLFNPQNSESSRLRFTLSETSRVSVKIFDGRDLLIRNLVKNSPYSTGEHVLTWDGKDEAGQIVPPEAYHYTIEAVSDLGEIAEYDLTDLTGGERIDSGDVKWLADTQRIQYVLNRPARINIRIGLENNGPLLRTLQNWVPREAGLQFDHWDGMDQSNVLDLTSHPKRYIRVLAYTLSDNTIIVGPQSDDIRLIASMPWGQIKREPKKNKRKHMYDHSQQPIETRKDVRIKLVLPSGLPLSSDGIPEVSGTVPVRLEVMQEDRVLVVNRRHEPVFYIDGQYSWENEVGFLPMTWMLDTSKISNGIHYVTANLLGYEGNFGIATIKIVVKHE